MTRYKGFNVAFLFNLAYIGVAKASVAEKILSSTTHIDKSLDYDMLFPWLGTGLLTSKGEKWFERRKLLTPAFHFKILDDFMDVFNEQANVLVQTLKNEFGYGNVFNIFPFITRCTLDIISETAMGVKINAQSERESDYVNGILRITDLIQYRQVRPWFHSSFIWGLSSSGREEKKILKVLHSFTQNVIKERKAELRSKTSTEKKDNDDEFYGKKRRVAFLDILLETQQRDGDVKLTDQDIREETDTFMFEGHDTTAASANWASFLLASEPECQAKVHAELDEIFGDDKNRPITTSDLSKMKYLECCIKESLRLYPSVPFIARAINSDLKLDDDVVIPSGSITYIMPYSLHRDPTVFPEPEAFDPQRFFPENCIGRSPYAFVPFSAGPRNCIGQKFAMMEEKVILANLFRNFRLEAAERRSDLIILAELIMRPKHGLHVKIFPR